MKKTVILSTVIVAALAEFVLAPPAAHGAVIVWNFGDDNATFDGGTPQDFSVGDFSIGRPNGTVGDPVNSSSASNLYPGASGGGNIGNATRPDPALDPLTNSFFEVTFTPAAGFKLQITDFDFGARSTSTGARSYALLSSVDNFTAPIFTSSFGASSVWTFQNPAPFSLAGGDDAPVTLRLFTYLNTGGTPTVNTITTRLDDIAINVTAVPAVAAQNHFWDTNGTAAGSNNAGGNFSGANWNLQADGTGTPGAFADGDTPTFSAGNNATGAFTVAIDTGVNANGLSFEEGTVTLSAAGGSLTLTGTIDAIASTVNVATGAAAIIEQPLLGTVGLTKAGAGSLRLAVVNSYTGPTAISGGVLSIADDLNLGATSNGVILNSGTLQTTGDNVSLDAARTLTGSGSIAPLAGTSLTINGAIDTGALTVADSGFLFLATSGATKRIGSLIFASPATVVVTGDSLVLAGNVTTTHADGSAVLSGLSVILEAPGASTVRTINVADGAAATDFSISANLSGIGILNKVGAGTLELIGDNLLLSGGVRLGIASSVTATTGGVLAISNKNALGTGTFQANGGTLRANEPLTGPAALTNTLSIGARNQAATTPGGAIFAGSDIEFTGPASIFRVGNATAIQQFITVNNTTTLSGVFGPSTSSGAGQGVSTGLTITGSGTLVLAGAAPNTFVEPVTVAGTATLNAAKNGALGANSGISVSAGGRVLFSNEAALDRLSNSAPFTLNGGTLLTAGLSENNGDDSAGIGPVILSLNSVIDLGTTTLMNDIVRFADSRTQTWTGTLSIYNWNGDEAGGGIDQLFFGNDSLGLLQSQLDQVQFFSDAGLTSLGSGSLLNTGELVPIPEPSAALTLVAMLGLAGCLERRRSGRRSPKGRQR